MIVFRAMRLVCLFLVGVQFVGAHVAIPATQAHGNLILLWLWALLTIGSLGVTHATHVSMSTLFEVKQ